MYTKEAKAYNVVMRGKYYVVMVGKYSMWREIGSHYKVDNDFLRTFQELKPPDYNAKPP